MDAGAFFFSSPLTGGFARLAWVAPRGAAFAGRSMRPCTQQQRLENRMVKTDEVLRTLLGMGFGCDS